MSRPLFSPVAIGEMFGVHPETLRRLHRCGRIPGYMVGRRLRFDPDEVRAALRTTSSPSTCELDTVGLDGEQ